uniref:Uncharacterized protein n=1 Tax=Lepeophtheirus salmonis TaxID=72036 RepID=A0A0K2V6F0_LEPSM
MQLPLGYPTVFSLFDIVSTLITISHVNPDIIDFFSLSIQEIGISYQTRGTLYFFFFLIL